MIFIRWVFDVNDYAIVILLPVNDKKS